MVQLLRTARLTKSPDREDAMHLPSRFHFLSLLLAAVAVTVTVAGMAAAQNPSAVDTELERVRGHWRVVELLENGQEIPDDQMQYWLPGGGNLEIVDYTVLFESPLSGAKTTREFRIDPTSYPKRITIKNKDTETGKGIYKFDGGKLVVCISRDTAQVPTEFAAPKDSARALIVMERYEPNNSATPKGAPRPAPKPVHANPPDMSQWKSAEVSPPSPPPSVVPAGGVTSRVLTDAEVREMAVGTWRMTDNEGSVDVTYNEDGTFQTYRYYQMLQNFQYVFVPTPISSGTWQISNGRLVSHVTASSRADMANQTYMPAVRSISATDLILVDNYGRVSRAVKVR
jgi:uncharacterized protein (TIGR03067 family)